jgi:hypothetical protein
MSTIDTLIYLHCLFLFSFFIGLCRNPLLLEKALVFVRGFYADSGSGNFHFRIDNKGSHRPQSGRPFPKLLKKETAK